MTADQATNNARNMLFKVKLLEVAQLVVSRAGT